ncbi:MAG: DUF84 family protein [Blastochloris sp.]|nr:DUF84 family protein [Blastochloris sp.]
MKINAIQSVMERVQLSAAVHAVGAPSGVASQPIGVAEITHGARQRAVYAHTTLHTGGLGWKVALSLIRMVVHGFLVWWLW